MELQSEPSNLKIFISWLIIVMISGITGWVANSEPPDLWYKTDNVSYQSHPHQYEWLKVGPLSLKHYESHSVGLFMDIIDVSQEASILLNFNKTPKNISVNLLDSGKELSLSNDPYILKLPTLSPGVHKIVVNSEWFQGEVSYRFKVRVSE